MLKEELSDKMNNTLIICDMHYQRMIFAWEQVKKHFPVSGNILKSLSPVELALFDQLIYRFLKLQDVMGSRLFRQILEMLGEDVSGIPFIDILNRMEKLELINKAEVWIKLRETRNAISHEYPFEQDEQAGELNLLITDIGTLSDIWLKLKAYSLSRL
jgi:hypothetical protein